MSNALAIAASGLKSGEFYIDKLANDIANLNTNNYKASKISFEDMVYQSTQATPLSKNQQRTQIGLGASVLNTSVDFTIGPLKQTNNWNDVAIDGSGFFQVIHSDGNIVYTRNSSLSIDREGYLATNDGLRLADDIQLPEDFIEITIQKNGDVEALMEDDPEPQLLGTIKLAKFLNPEALKPLGSGLYTTTAQVTDPIVDSPGENNLGELIQQHVEGSNVDMVSSLMQLTMAQRVYQLNAKAVQIADELEKMINEIRD